ncbi:MAG: hypothetical protein GY723_18685 [bacterium]|nr:hypothetical protein [bacterium]MCP5066452.1 hypothetical protein [bacterium]
MARELGDVLHYFLDDASEAPEEEPKATACPIVAAPMHPRDAIRSVLLWNLAVELRHLGREPVLLATELLRDQTRWLDLASEKLKPAWVTLSGRDVGPLLDTARAAANSLLQERDPVVLVHVPSNATWSDEHKGLFERCWLVVGGSDEDRQEFLELCERVLIAAPRSQIGVTVRGAETVPEARRIFDGLAELFEARFGHSLTSYGLLVDELELAQGLAEHHPGNPTSRSTRALRDVAELLRDDLH